MHNEKGGVPRHLPGRSLGWADWVRLVFALLPAAIVLQAQAPVENVVYSFLNFPNGASPYAPLTRDSTGNLYGTTNQGGESNLGVVFELDTSGKETVLHSFRGGADGANPYSGLLRSSSGTIYGTTYQGGTDNAGVVFEIGPSGHEKVLYTFTGGADGGNPYAGVIADSAGNLYGTTYYGGTANAGVVYKLAPSGQETVLYSFSGGADGSNPRAGLISDSDGNLYGTTVSGGAFGPYWAGGVVYKVSPAGQETVLYSFNGQGFVPSVPFSGVIRDSDGNLYGTTSARNGAVYKLDTAGNLSVLHNFSYNGGPSQPEGNLAQDAAGNIYGSTQFGPLVGGVSGHGVVYKIDTARSFTILYAFPGSSPPGTSTNYPNAGPILDPNGNLYGTTPYGGVNGLVYEISAAGQRTTLYNFAGAPGGTKPISGVSQDPAGNLYGSTQLGGAANCGVVYRLDLTGRQTAVYSFTGGTDGSDPESTPVLNRQGNIFGTATGGGAGGFGTVYEISSSGGFTVLHAFTGGADGGLPRGVALDSSGNLYGGAGYGAYGRGVVYKITPSGKFTVLYSFTGELDGGDPGELTLDSSGNIYGSTHDGGEGGFGVIYKLSSSGQETVLYSFAGTDGAGGGAKLWRDSAGNLYGTTSAGGGTVGGSGSGVVFELSAAGDYEVLYRFTGGIGGGLPDSGAIRDAAGNLYGTTEAGGTTNCSGGCGVVYKLAPSGVETVLYTFTGGADGDSPYAPLLMDSAGNLYGTTPWGGNGGVPGITFSGGGVIFKITP